MQLNLLESEIDLVVNGLLEAKKRMQVFKELKNGQSSENKKQKN